MPILRKILKAALFILLLLVLSLAGIIVYALITDYKPTEISTQFTSANPDRLSDTAAISIITWNIGYCGLDSAMDFFFDGGVKVRTPEIKFLENLSRIKEFIKGNDTIDFFLIQEIDQDSKRSYHINEFDIIGKSLEAHHPFFAKNYEVFFVPVPLSSPMGKVLSGLATFSRYQPSTSVRYSLPGEYSFPKQLFMLDRCFLVNRYSLENGKELLIINTHNEAFDQGYIRKAQMDYLKEFLLMEYNKGNYVITGGDWNQTPPGFQAKFQNNQANTEQMMMPAGFLPPDWHWIFDSTIPSNRSVITAYDPDATATTVIDLFLLSPNIKAISSECLNLGFENSDHNPVRIKVQLLKNELQDKFY